MQVFFLLNYLFYVNVLLISTASKYVKIALHGQVSPKHGKIVGSVITTNSLKNSFIRRPEVLVCEIFFPYSYQGLYDHKWNLIIIEGWFPSIHDFIQLTRFHSPHVIIIFYCLDPIFPGIDAVKTFDVDGILTNSKLMISALDHIPSAYVLLAASPEIMKPYDNIEKNWGAVYVGAGGGMVYYKRNLVKILEDVKKFNLKIYGSNWNEVESLAESWHGILPQDELALAYASGHSVISSIIDAQSEVGMVNNRVFEALACGAILISDFSPALYELVGDLVYYVSDNDIFRCMSSSSEDIIYITAVNETDFQSLSNFTSCKKILTRTAASHVEYVMKNSDDVIMTRKLSRDFIIGGHTWDHRVIEIIDFYNELKFRQDHDQTAWKSHVQEFRSPISLNSYQLPRSNAPRLAWIVSSKIIHHPDYILMVKTNVFYGTLVKYFSVFIISEHDWFHQFANPFNTTIQIFDVIVIVGEPFGKLEHSVRSLPPMMVDGKDKHQRRAFYSFGFDEFNSRNQFPSTNDEDLTHNIKRYDLIWFRDPYELDLWRIIYGINLTALLPRLQHCYGVAFDDEFDTNISIVKDIEPFQSIVCMIGHEKTCVEFLQKLSLTTILETIYSYRVLLLGGSWNDWLSSFQQSKLNEFIYSILPILNHISRDGGTAHATNIIRKSIKITICYNFYSLDNRETSNGNRIFTTGNVLWPLVVALTAGIKVHLVNHNDHIIYVVNSFVNGWNLKYFQSHMESSLRRLAGMASASSSAKIKQLLFTISHSKVSQNNAVIEVSDNQQYFNWQCFNGSWVTPSGMKPFMVLRLSFDHFQPGRDGEFCLYYHGNYVICLTTRVDFIIFYLNISCETVSPLTVNKKNNENECINVFELENIEVECVAHGPMFLDELFKIVVPLTIPSICYHQMIYTTYGFQYDQLLFHHENDCMAEHNACADIPFQTIQDVINHPFSYSFTLII
jgi:glycosyltransferase involved in cell wall biosynthesis